MLTLGTSRGTLNSLGAEFIGELLPVSATAPDILDVLPGLQQEDGRDKRRSPTPQDAQGEHGLSCNTCGIGTAMAPFDSIEQQRSHFQTDWHRLNMRRRLAARAPVSEQQFEHLMEHADEVSSISGSASSSEESSAQQGRLQHQQGHQAPGLSCFRHADGSIVAVWKSLMEPASQKGAFSQQQLLVNLQALSHAQGRAKSGGRQSGKDATGKYAKSAGSTIRRHNEAMLKQEIQGLLLAWRAHLQSATLIFVHAPAGNAAPIFSTEPCVLERQDKRIRSIPFNTRRPTFSETQRIMRMLLTVYSVEEDDRAGAESTEQTGRKQIHQVDRAQTAPSGPSGQAAVEAASPNLAAAEVPPVEEIAAPVVETELHAAARSGDAARVTQLLEQHADPTAISSEGKTAYSVAGSKAARDAFRRYMAVHPDQWDWLTSGVPSALTPELEAQQAARQAEKRARQRERERERKRVAAQDQAEAAAQARAAAEAEIEAAAAEAAALSLRSKAAPPKQVNSADARARARREQLAAAAEARMAAVHQTASQQQLW